MQVPEGWNPVFEVSAEYKEQIFSMSPGRFLRFLSENDISGRCMIMAQVVCDLCWRVAIDENSDEVKYWLLEVWLPGIASSSYPPYISIPYMVRTAVNIIKESDDDIKLDVMAGLVRTINAYFPGEAQVREES